MKKFLMALAVLALVSAPALAGPNADGTLVVHDTGLTYTFDSAVYPSDAPSCENVDNEIALGAFAVWKVYAAFPDNASPRLKALVMGEQFDAATYVLAGGLPDPVADFEITQNGWPLTSGGGVGISFGTVKTTLMVECYWFGGYNYTGGAWAVAPHPTQTMIFVDDSVPPLEDPITALGSVGFGVAGNTPCPIGPAEGACCFPDGTCQLLFADACLGAGGIVFGGPCDPNPCPEPPPQGACCFGADCVITTQSLCIAQGGAWFGGECEPNPCAVPVEETTWGAIKANYR